MFLLGNDFGCLLTAVGAYACVLYFYKHFKSPLCLIWSVLFRKNVPLKERYGRWAVITGASDGIGREYARNLARNGLDIVLISRTESKLVQLAKEIISQFGVDVKWITVDFSDGSEQVYDKIQSGLAGIEVGILVNNVGVVHENPAKFEEIPLKDIQQTVSVNICPSLRLTHMILPEMKRRRRGIIINVSSAAAFTGMAYISVYGASKAFLNSITAALQLELSGSGVECQLVTPIFVNTNMTQQWQSIDLWTLFSVGVERFTRMAVWTIGKVESTTGYWSHGLQLTILSSAPQWALETLIAFIMRLARRKVFRKQHLT
ncbi:putative steroid dehydrogenase 4 [Toxorhynchites rutilus septentrionalis]|uniref:putative steroid dehydrogenase 4 n=1 Tax=Toxorhynchites rutilus septentrionalis TaxID=329112 RepID=UPI00247851C0|nr:putative steroid dehydrogenase 4 [Toxorhynchites rutilus septentrionalis]